MKRATDGLASIRASVDASAAGIAALGQEAGTIAAIGRDLVGVLRSGGKVLTAGNGGSAAEALHMAEELVGRFQSNRRSLAGLSLAADPTALTCIANDFGFDEVFRRQIEGLGRPGDLLVLFSTSGAAANLSLALASAKRRRMKVVCLLGRDGGRLAGRGTREIIVRGRETARIQEAHQVIVHLLLEIVERAFAK
jgi:D-sedoheptulose 7-phosphate isomerase